jgi:TolB-like protein
MTDELITDLAQISALRVISRTSVMAYKGARKPLPQIARELNVDAIVEGTVLRSGDQVRITAQLIEASTDKHLWSQSYEGDLRDTLALQSRVASAIADQIRISLTPQEKAALKDARVVKPEAYESYLKAATSGISERRMV